MPKQLAKQEVLNGLGSVVLYGSGTSSGKYFYKQWVKEQKKYVQRQIPNASSMDEAVIGCLDVAFKLKEELGNPELKPARKKSSHTNKSTPKESISGAIEGWIAIEQERADAELISEGTVKSLANTLRKHVQPYLEGEGIYYTDAITPSTFDGYLIYRSDTTPMVRSQELKRIKTWLRKYCAKRGLVKTEWLVSDDFLPKQVVKETDRLKNPAINPDDWNTITVFVKKWRDEVKHNTNQRYWYWRNLIWHFILFSKNSGMSPEEVIKMKWRQIELIDEGRWDSKGERQVWEVAYVSTTRSKTQATREIPVNQARELRRWREFVLEQCKLYDLPMPNANTEVFGNPFPRSGSKEGWRPYHRSMFSAAWKELMERLDGQLKGHRHSPHPYTQYSMRSSFIEDHLLKGTSVVEVARMAGHNIVETQRSYERLDLRKRGGELTKPKFGTKKIGQRKVEQLF